MQYLHYFCSFFLQYLHFFCSIYICFVVSTKSRYYKKKVDTTKSTFCFFFLEHSQKCSLDRYVSGYSVFTTKRRIEGRSDRKQHGQKGGSRVGQIEVASTKREYRDTYLQRHICQLIYIQQQLVDCSYSSCRVYKPLCLLYDESTYSSHVSHVTYSQQPSQLYGLQLYIRHRVSM